jgi:hypothetical protein
MLMIHTYILHDIILHTYDIDDDDTLIIITLRYYYYYYCRGMRVVYAAQRAVQMRAACT